MSEKGAVVGMLAGGAAVVAMGALGVLPVFSVPLWQTAGYFASAAIGGGLLGSSIEDNARRAAEPGRFTIRVQPVGVEMQAAGARGNPVRG